MSEKHFTIDTFRKHIDVSRETFSQLENYVSLLKKWQAKINLISNSTVEHIWERHILDSAQLIKYIDSDKNVVDIGSGAGLPGIILAILGITDMTLIESDNRKTIFLKEAARVAHVNPRILNHRVEACELGEADIITARGFSSLSSIVEMVAGKIKKEAKLLLLKGKSSDSEISEALRHWAFDYKKFHSITEPQSSILIIENILKTGG